MRSRVLILGASGFIGSRMAHAFSNSDRFEVLAIARSASRSLGLSGVSCLDMDVTDARTLGGVFRKGDAIVNCIAGSGRSIVQSAEAIAAAVGLHGGLIQVINLSSMAVYGEVEGRVNERMVVSGGSDEYSQAKLASERALSKLPSVVTFRPGIVYGPGSSLWTEYVGRLLVCSRLGNLGPGGEGVCNLVYVDDVVTAVSLAIGDNSLSGEVFNLASAEPPTWNEYFRVFGAALGVTPLQGFSSVKTMIEANVLSLPRKLLGAVGSHIPRLGIQPLPVLRPWLVQHCRRSITQDVTKAQSMLSMDWTPLDRGIHASARWLQSLMDNEKKLN